MVRLHKRLKRAYHCRPRGAGGAAPLCTAPLENFWGGAHPGTFDEPKNNSKVRWKTVILGARTFLFFFIFAWQQHPCSIALKSTRTKFYSAMCILCIKQWKKLPVDITPTPMYISCNSETINCWHVTFASKFLLFCMCYQKSKLISEYQYQIWIFGSVKLNSISQLKFEKIVQ